ncbi:MAG: protein kinase family protein [Carnobacterium sp.]|nr:protein kinase family protein [Carnobacterium sp.]
METGENIRFDQVKHFKFVRELGSGGTGETNLFKDETTSTLFAIKKYRPSKENTNHKEDFYHRFVEEIVILFKLSHPNIVRVYNYYLYPNFITGFLQMEYIEGASIDIYVGNNSTDLDKLFRSAVNAFECLEENNILHRDIRPANIMIDNNGELKLIDFGFGKILSSTNTENSILLNWPVTEMPDEVVNGKEYTVETEIYFLGCLFKKLVRENNIKKFKFTNIMNKMCEISIENRYKSFKNISADIAKGILLGTDFSISDKTIYQNMANSLINIIDCYDSNFMPVLDVEKVQEKLGKVISSSSLEQYIQDSTALIRCFIKNGCFYHHNELIKVEVIKDFYKLLMDSDSQKKNIILDNLITRLSLVEIQKPKSDNSDDDLPF